MEVDPEDLAAAKVLLTVVDGGVVIERARARS
jgi:hypothetical protein